MIAVRLYQISIVLSTEYCLASMLRYLSLEGRESFRQDDQRVLFLKGDCVLLNQLKSCFEGSDEVNYVFHLAFP